MVCKLLLNLEELRQIRRQIRYNSSFIPNLGLCLFCFGRNWSCCGLGLFLLEETKEATHLFSNSRDLFNSLLNICNRALSLFVEFTPFAYTCNAGICKGQKSERINVLLLLLTRKQSTHLRVCLIFFFLFR